MRRDEASESLTRHVVNGEEACVRVASVKLEHGGGSSEELHVASGGHAVGEVCMLGQVMARRRARGDMNMVACVGGSVVGASVCRWWCWGRGVVDLEGAIHEGVGVLKAGEGVCLMRVGR